VVDDPRTLLAAERTLLAWLRTGVSLLTFGIFIAKLGFWLRAHPDAPSFPSTTLIGCALVVLGALTETVGIVRYLRVRRALLAHRPVPLGAVDMVALAAMVALLGFYGAVRLLTKAVG
jgi:putative membrane protein